MGADISVGIAVQGEREFNKALTACQNTLKQLDSSLKANAAGFEDSAAGMSSSAQRARLLNSALEENRKMEAALGDAIEYATKEYGAASKETTKYVIAQNKAREAIARIEEELKDADREMEEFGRDSQKVARQIDNGITESAEKAGKSIDEMVESIKEDIGGISVSSTISAIKDAGDAIFGTFSTVNSFAESSRDRRRELAMLETNAMLAKQDYEAVYDIAMGVAALTGGMNASIEGTSALLRTGFDTEEITLAIETLGGAVVAFPETMKFENLAESLQESMAAGEATGAFAELMERCGINTEDFKNAMAAAATEEEKQQVALSFLNSMGLRPTYEAYTNINEGLINAQASTDKLSDAMTRLGGTVDEKITPIKDGIAEAVLFLDDFLNKGVSVLGMTEEQAIQFSNRWIGGSTAFAEPLTAQSYFEAGEAIKRIMGMDEETIKKEIATGNAYFAQGGFLEDFKEMLPIEEAKKFINEKVVPIKDEMARVGTEAVNALFNAIAEMNKGEEVPTETITHNFFEGMEQTAPIEEAKTSADAIWQTFEEESGKGGKDAANKGITEFNDGIRGGGPLIQEEMLISGTNGGNAFAQGISIGCASAIDIAAQTASSINAIFAQIQAPVVPAISGTYYADAGGGYGSGLGSYNISMNIDGRRFGSVTAGYTSAAQAQFVSRLSRLNA